VGERAYVDVPFAEKDDAKRCGARWDAQVRRWYAPPGQAGLSRWAPEAPLPAVLPGAGVNREHQVWLEAHERWDYHHTSRTQRLRRLVCLCTRCHQATHFGDAEITGRAEAALAQLCAVNHWTRADAEAHIAAAASLWRWRSETDWALDLSILTGVGITPQPNPTPAQRRTQAPTDLDRPSSPPPG